MGKSNLRKCKLCSYQTLHWEFLKDHIRNQHTEYFNNVQKWLNDTVTDEELLADRLSKEGMIGRTSANDIKKVHKSSEKINEWVKKGNV